MMYCSDSVSAFVSKSMFVDLVSSEEILPKYDMCMSPAFFAVSMANFKRSD